MRLKRLYFLLLCSSAGVYLSACVNDAGDSSAGDKAANKTSVLKDAGINEAKGVWGGVPSADTEALDGVTTFKMSNDSDAVITSLGCYSSSDTDMKLGSHEEYEKKYEPHLTPKVVANSKALWMPHEIIPGGIYAANGDDESNEIRIYPTDGGAHTVISSGGEIRCLYELNDGVNKPMYFKLVGNSNKYATPSLNPFFSIDKPYQDSQKVQAEEAKWPNYATLGIGVSALALEASLTAYKYRKLDPNEVLQQIINSANKLNRAYYNSTHFKDIKSILSELQQAFDNIAKTVTENPEMSPKDLNALTLRNFKHDLDEISDRHYARSRRDFNEINSMVDRLYGSSRLETPIVQKMKYTMEGGTFGIEADYKVNKGSMTSTRYPTRDLDLFRSDMAGAMAEVSLNLEEQAILLEKLKEFPREKLGEAETWQNIAAENYSDNITLLAEEVAGILADKGVAASKEAEMVAAVLSVTQKVPVVADVANLISRENSTALIETLVELQRTVKFFKIAKTMTLATGVAELALVPGIQILLDRYTLPDAVDGSYDISLEVFKITEVTAQDIVLFKTTHPDSVYKIDTDTEVLSGESNNSYFANYSLKLRPAPGKQDDYNLQSSYTLNIASLSTPWLRTQGKDDDPYDGNVGHYTKTKGNATLRLSVSSQNKPSSPLELAQYEAFKNSPFGSNLTPFMPAPKKVAPAQLMRLGTSLSLADPLLQSRKLKTLLLRVGNVDAEIIPVGGALSLSLTTDRLTDSSQEVFNNASLSLDFVPHDPQHDRSLQFASSMDALKDDTLLLGASDAVYAGFTCNLPYKLGSICGLNIASVPQGSLHSSAAKSSGTIYVSTGLGSSLAVPVMIGYNLALDSNDRSVDEGDVQPFNVSFKVANFDGYDHMEVVNLPAGAKILNGSALLKKFAYADSGKVSLDISGLAEGEYNLMIRGVSADGNSTENDTENFILRVNPSI